MAQTFDRGEIVETGSYENPMELIYITTIEGCNTPYICVSPWHAKDFKAGRTFQIMPVKKIWKKGERQVKANEPRRNRPADYTKHPLRS